jgi:CubicO group peptidase (beta-lactamase class C family)
MQHPIHPSLVLALVGVSFAACSSAASPSAGALSTESSDGGGPTHDAAPRADARVEAGAEASTEAEAGVDDPPIDPRYQSFAAAFDQERQKLGAPGAAVALIEHGQLTFFHGFGTKLPSGGDPVRAHTLFRIGSMTKALTATALSTLVQEGKVSLDATLKSVVPDVGLPAGADLLSLTIRELLTHESGLADYAVDDASHDDSALSSYLTSATFSGVEYFMDPPGSFWNYSNPNYYLAGLVVERAGGALYRQAMSARVFAPLGMTRTFFLPSEVLSDGDYADGKSLDANGKPWDVKPDSYDNAWGRPAGYAFTSVLDYARFVQFLLQGNPSVLADAQRLAMETAQVSTQELGNVSGYGYGLEVDQGLFIGASWYATPLVYHSGAIPGFATEFLCLPGTGFGLVAFASADGAYFSDSVGLAVESFASLPSPSTGAPNIAPDPSTYPAIAGTYDDATNVGVITVTATTAPQPGLGIAIPSFDSSGVTYDKTLTPTGPNDFSFNIQGQPEDVTFIPDGKGGYAWLRTRYFVGQRQP